MADLQGISNKTKFLSALRNITHPQAGAVKIPSKLSTTHKPEIKDDVLISSSIKPDKNAKEDDFVSVIISSDNNRNRNTFLSPSSIKPGSSSSMPRKIKVEEKLKSGEVIAQLDKKSIDNLEKDGFKVIPNNQDFLLPILPSAKQSKKTQSSQDVVDNVLKLNNVNATTKLDQLTSTGKGIGIAILDTGVAPHPDIKNKIIAFKDFVNGKDEPYDDNGHGTHVSGDAAGTGALSEGKYKGTAPDANIVGVKVLNSEGGAKISDIVRGIDWVIENKNKYNIRIINMSIGVPSAGYTFDPIDKAVERAVGAGIVVVAAAGNEGPKGGTIGGAPGNSPFALTVGAIDDKGTPEKDDDEIAPFSSRGPTIDGVAKPDIVAPGNDIISLNIAGSQVDKIAKAVKYLKQLPDEKLCELPPELFAGLGLDVNITSKAPKEIRKYLDKNLPNINYVNEYYVSMPGTSMAAPLVSGIVADMLETNPDLDPTQVKEILVKTADDMGAQKFAQGAGVIDPLEAIYEASTVRGTLPIENKFDSKKISKAVTRAVGGKPNLNTVSSLALNASNDMGYLVTGSGGGTKVKHT